MNEGGFGNSDITAPYNYGSVADGFTDNPTLEQRMRKKYWKTKQTVRTKLHKQEDEFVVAGDADIDTKLEASIVVIHQYRPTGLAYWYIYPLILC